MVHFLGVKGGIVFLLTVDKLVNTSTYVSLKTTGSDPREPLLPPNRYANPLEFIDMVC